MRFDDLAHVHGDYHTVLNDDAAVNDGIACLLRRTEKCGGDRVVQGTGVIHRV